MPEKRVSLEKSTTRSRKRAIQDARTRRGEIEEATRNDTAVERYTLLAEETMEGA